MEPNGSTHRRVPSAGACLVLIGVVHSALGAVGFAPELAQIARLGVFAAVRDPRSPAAAALWFFALGILLVVMGALMRWVEVELDRPLPMRLAVGLVFIVAFLVLLEPASGAYSVLLPAYLVWRRARRERLALCSQPELKALIAGADHVDIKTVETGVALRPFIAAMLAYQPGWISALYWVRGAVVRVLRLESAGIPSPLRLRADELPTTPGAAVGFFRVALSVDQRLWAAQADDKHLRAHLGVLAQDAGQGRKRFHVFTVVHYKNWAGPVYFNLIRPFHHLVVSAMIRAALRAPGGRERLTPSSHDGHVHGVA